MLKSEHSEYLLRLPKKVEKNGVLNDIISFNQIFPFQERFYLIASDEPDYTFLYEVNQSKKNQFKLSLYLLDDDTKIGLLRLDYNGQHENPQTINDNVPDFLRPYAGKFFNYNEHHIHFYVEGYKTTLDWAFPIIADEFPVKEISNSNDIIEAFINFNRLINLITEFQINQRMMI